MWRAVWRIELRKTVPYYAVAVAALVVYVLLRQAPLGSGDLGSLALSALVGAWLADSVFLDAPGTGAFIFSLPVTRRRLFWYRWSLGIGLIAAGEAVVLIVILSGLRQMVQTCAFHPFWYPTMRWRELGYLWPLAAGAIWGYQVTGFSRLRWPSRQARPIGWQRFSLPTWIVMLFVLGGLGVLMSWERPSGPGDGWNPVTSGWFVAYIGVLTVLTAASSALCYRRLEIEA
jgi:hypothetical protein